MKYIYALLFLLPLAATGAELRPLKKPELSSVLGLVEEMPLTRSENKSSYSVRIFTAPTAIGECGGSVKSCPEVRLFVSISNGDLGEVPSLYQFPSSKGWKFGGWLPPQKSGAAAFKLKTILPDSNINLKARQQWREQSYIVNATTETASYERQ